MFEYKFIDEFESIWSLVSVLFTLLHLSLFVFFIFFILKFPIFFYFFCPIFLKIHRVFLSLFTLCLHFDPSSRGFIVEMVNVLFFVVFIDEFLQVKGS